MALIEGSGILKAIMLPEWVINIYYSVTSLHHSTAFHLACLSELSRIKQQLRRHPKKGNMVLEADRRNGKRSSGFIKEHAISA